MTNAPKLSAVSLPSDDEWARLELLAEVSDTLIRTLDTGESADQLARLLVPRLADWATVTVLAEDGADELTGRAHRDPGRPDFHSFMLIRSE